MPKGKAPAKNIAASPKAAVTPVAKASKSPKSGNKGKKANTKDC